MAGPSPRRDTSPVSSGRRSGAAGEERDPPDRRRLAARERRVEFAASALFAVVAGARCSRRAGRLGRAAVGACCSPPPTRSSTRVSFQLGPGSSSPTQLVFVPMLFLLPPEAVPALVAAGSMLSVLPDVVLRRAHPERLLVAVADSWYAVGPAAVFALSSPGDAGLGGPRHLRRSPSPRSSRSTSRSRRCASGSARASGRASWLPCSAWSTSSTRCCRRSASWRCWPARSTRTRTCSPCRPGRCSR